MNKTRLFFAFVSLFTSMSFAGEKSQIISLSVFKCISVDDKGNSTSSFVKRGFIKLDLNGQVQPDSNPEVEIPGGRKAILLFNQFEVEGRHRTRVIVKHKDPAGASKTIGSVAFPNDATTIVRFGDCADKGDEGGFHLALSSRIADTEASKSGETVPQQFNPKRDTGHEENKSWAY